MSLHMIFTILQLLPAKSSYLANQDDIITSSEGWSAWVYLLFSKGIYAVLVSLILICCVFDYVRDKIGGKNELHVGIPSWVDAFWNHVGGYRLTACASTLRSGRFPVPGLLGTSFEWDDEVGSSQLHERILNARTEMDALRKALELTRSSRIDLEESMEDMEKDKEETDGRTQEEKEKRKAEIDRIKKDTDSLLMHLAQLRKEKEEVDSRCDKLRQEANQAGVALRNRQDVEERLDETMGVVATLRQVVAELLSEREEAVETTRSLSSDLGLIDPQTSTASLLDDGNENYAYFQSWKSRSEVVPVEGGTCDRDSDDSISIADPTQVEAGDYLDQHVDDLIKKGGIVHNDQNGENQKDVVIDLNKRISLTDSAAFRKFVKNNFGQL